MEDEIMQAVVVVIGASVQCLLFGICGTSILWMLSRICVLCCC